MTKETKEFAKMYDAYRLAEEQLQTVGSLAQGLGSASEVVETATGAGLENRYSLELNALAIARDKQREEVKVNFQINLEKILEGVDKKKLVDSVYSFEPVADDEKAKLQKKVRTLSELLDGVKSGKTKYDDLAKAAIGAIDSDGKAYELALGGFVKLANEDEEVYKSVKDRILAIAKANIDNSFRGKKIKGTDKEYSSEIIDKYKALAKAVVESNSDGRGIGMLLRAKDDSEVKKIIKEAVKSNKYGLAQNIVAYAQNKAVKDFKAEFADDDGIARYTADNLKALSAKDEQSLFGVMGAVREYIGEVK